jgi:hypothetical protein
MKNEEDKDYLSVRDLSVSLVMRVKGTEWASSRGGVKTTGYINATRTQGRSLRPLEIV